MKHQHGGNLTQMAARYGLDPDKIIDFSVNVNPLGPSPAINTILENGLKYVTIYPDPYCETLKENCASRLGISYDNLIFTNGAVELIYMVMQALRPRSVLIPSPTFREYEIAARAFQAKLKLFRLGREKGFTPGLKPLMRAASDVDMVFLCNPNNPTGNLFPQEIRQPFLQFCDTEGIFVVVDESFLIFHQHWQELSAAIKTENNKNLLVLQSLTKFFSIPGLRVGYGAAHPQIISLLSRFQPPWQVNAIAQAAAAASLQDEEYCRRTRSFVEEERRWLESALSAARGVKVHPSQGPYLLLELDGALAAPCVAERLAARGILVRDCSNFAYLGKNYIRVAVKDREKNRLLVNELTGLLKS